MELVGIILIWFGWTILGILPVLFLKERDWTAMWTYIASFTALGLGAIALTA